MRGLARISLADTDGGQWGLIWPIVRTFVVLGKRGAFPAGGRLIQRNRAGLPRPGTETVRGFRAAREPKEACRKRGISVFFGS